jgi:Tol biopolymer transport system component
MPLALGTRLGPYEILAPLGAGGMGEVYRAKDTRLDRSVAIKVLPSDLVHDPGRRARFEREAKAVSSLNHPHICTLHDVGHEQGTDFLVMELVEGETLAERLKKGALPLDRTLRHAIEIADALDKAHRQGVIHRDLKPGNVMLTKSGAKLMDFGLAKRALAKPAAAALAPSSLPTESAPAEERPLTAEGSILGTFQYMAPELLEAKEADARSDIWAFGCVLYEMATGRRPFEGKSQASLIGAIMDKEPQPITQLQPLTPPSLERLVKVCLAKDPDDRLQTAHDVMQELKWIAEMPSGVAAVGGGAPSGGVRGGRGLASLLVGLALLAGVILGGLVERRLLAPVAARPQVLRALLDVGPAEELNSGGYSPASVYTPGGSRTALSFTPDGRSLVFAGRRGGIQQLYVRSLDSNEARPLAGTEGAQVLTVSPDGHWVAFWADRAIRKVPLAGGPAAVMVEEPSLPMGLAWGEDGRLFYGPKDGVIWTVGADGAPAALTQRLDGEISHSLPHLLPGGQALLYTVRHRVWTWGDEEVVAHVFATGERRVLLKGAADGRYVATGYLVFLRRGVLYAAEFDAARWEVRGSPEPVVETVAQALTAGNSADITGAGQFAVAATGALGCVRRPVAPHPDRQLVAVDRRGRITPLDAPTRGYSPEVDISPDGRRVALSDRGLGDQALWIHDLDRGTLTRLPGSGELDWPRCTPDGQRVAFYWLNKGVAQIAWMLADGTAAPEVLVPEGGYPSSWSPDGHRLAFVRGGDIWVAELEGGRVTAAPLSKSPETERSPEFSPDGRWLAFGSDVSGRFEVYVQPYPGPGPRQLVSLNGGESPAWSPTGRELLFVSPPDPEGRRQMMAVDVRSGPPFEVGRPRPIFAFSQPPLLLWSVPCRCYAVTADGQRFYATQDIPVPPPPPVTHLQLVLNWTEELKARVAAGRAK